jgi:hypothetical protein
MGLTGRAGIGHLGDEGNLLGRAPAPATERHRPADADPAIAAHQFREFNVPAVFLERLASVRRAPLRRPVLRKPLAHIPAEGVCGRPHVMCGKRGHVVY